MSRVLIVDDDPSVRRMLQLTFESAGFDVALASNGNEALRTLENDHIDLTILDIVMPEKEGIETLTEMRQSSPGVRVIAISGGARFGVTGEVRLEANDVLKLAKRLGADECFTKPVDNTQLLEVARRLTNS